MVIGPCPYSWDSLVYYQPIGSNKAMLGRVYLRSKNTSTVLIGTLIGDKLTTAVVGKNQTMTPFGFSIYKYFIEVFNFDNISVVDWLAVSHMNQALPVGTDSTGNDIYAARLKMQDQTLYGYITNNVTCAWFVVNKHVHCSTLFEILGFTCK